MKQETGSQINMARRTAVLVSGVFAMGLLLVLAQSIFAAAGGTESRLMAQNNQQAGQVITSTSDLGDYLKAHTISFDNQPSRNAELSSTAGFVGGAPVIWSGTTFQFGNPGSVVAYSLTLSNTSGITDTYDITTSGGWLVGLSGSTYTITAGTDASVVVSVTVPVDAARLETNLSVITATAQSDAMIYDVITLTTTTEFFHTFLPSLHTPLVPTHLSATRPNSQNDWALQWDSVAGATAYELQQSQDPNFATGVTTFNLGSNATSQLINTHEPSWNNVFYYRGRVLSGSQVSDWSNVVTVVGAYYDEFDNPGTGWDRRRLTNIDQTTTFYEIRDGNDWLIVQSLDSWDWVIASPMKPAPVVPYVIEYRIKHANLGNLVSHGAVFGADWNGGLCPDWSSVQGVYQHTACFNHFYDTNTIFFSDLKMLFERVDNLVWCPTCGGSPMKRLGDIESNPNNVPVLTNVDPIGWNTFRIEVRADGIKFYANGALQSITDGETVYTDTRWINSPYFGIIATTDEYSNSSARVEYFKVTPLDN